MKIPFKTVWLSRILTRDSRSSGNEKSLWSPLRAAKYQAGGPKEVGNLPASSCILGTVEKVFVEQAEANSGTSRGRAKCNLAVYTHSVLGSTASCFMMASSGDLSIQMNGGVHHGGTTCCWRLSSLSSWMWYLSARIGESRSSGLRFLFIFSDDAISTCRGVVQNRIVALRAFCSSCCGTGSKCASTSTAAPAVVRKAPVTICAARRWIRPIVWSMALSLPVFRAPGWCHAEYPCSIWGTIIALYTCRRLTGLAPYVYDASADKTDNRLVAFFSTCSR